jgi:hypothetical protein
MTTKLRYSDYAQRINVDALEEAIGFEVIRHDRGNDIGHCIFPENHKTGDSTGKFAIERDEKLYNCFVCGGGTLLSLAMESQNMDVDEATKWLYQFTHGEHQTDDEFVDDLILMLEDAEKRVETMPYFNQRVLERFDGRTDYFRSRGISDKVIDKYNLCFAFSVEKRMKDEVYVGPASIWPHYWRGRLVGWQYRWQDWTKDRSDPSVPKWLPKWTNTTDFPKSTTLFNYDVALKAEEPVVVCESLGTVLFCATYDVPAVAYFGSKPTPEQLRLLRRFSQGIILAPDNDSNLAGDKVLGSMSYLERFIPVWIADKVAGKDGADLGDYAEQECPETFLKRHLEDCITPSDSFDF